MDKRKNSMVSVCMITYGHEMFIRQAIEGVLMQEFDSEIELIIANDCSPDSTDAVIQEVIKHHPRGFWIQYSRHNSNIGMMPNFIFALEQCTGKYIALCDGDDYWTDPLKLQKQVDFLENNDGFSMCFHDAVVLHNNKKVDFYVNKNKTVFSTDDLFNRHFIPTASIVFRNILDYPEWFTHVASGDRLLVLLVSEIGKIKCLDDVMAVYRLHNGGVSNTHFGIKKVYDTALLLHRFNELTGFKFTQQSYNSLAYEIHEHVCSENKSLNYYTTNELLNEILTRIKKRLKKIFK